MTFNQIKSFRGAASITLTVLAVAGLVLSGCSKTAPDDGAEAKMRHFDNLRAVRYCEVFLIAGNPITKNLQAVFYNTSELNDAANKKIPVPRRFGPRSTPRG